MAKYKQVNRPFLFGKVVEYWWNMVKNYNHDVGQDKFFDILTHKFDHARAIRLIEAAFSADELKSMKECGSYRMRLDLDDELSVIFQRLWNTPNARTKCRAILEIIKNRMLSTIRKVKADETEIRFRELKRALKLTDVECDVLTVAYVVDQTCLNWPYAVSDVDKPIFYAMALDRSYDEVKATMHEQGKLRKFNLLDAERDFNFAVIGGFMEGTDSKTIERRFYKKNETSEILPWSFYGELAAKDGAILERMLASNPTKCNILLYGAPGTGKTSFARSLAKRLGRTAWEIRQGDDEGKNMKSMTRLMGIQVCNDKETADESLMIIDEADALLCTGRSSFDLMLGGGRPSTAKGIVNTILDEMKIPAVWISNAPAEAMDESVRRRFDYSIAFESLNNTQRISIWKNLVVRHELGSLISSDQIEDYATQYATSAGGISIVLDNVRRMKPTAGEVDALVDALMKPHCKLMEMKEPNRFLPAKGYSLDGLNIKGPVELGRIVTAVENYLDADFSLASEDKPRMNILLFGPPGTGKTEFVKYLGKRLGRKISVLKGSDILSKFVGEAEQNIAAAFRRAECEHAILFFDEIDGLVQSRENAHASWEVSQVNELLQQMENFNGVMIAATNFCTNLDAAIMRRFTFKFEFDYLDDVGKKLFFERTFKTTLADDEYAELKELGNLAPGDFRTVRQGQFYLGKEQSNAERIAALREECLLKKDGVKTARIGFAA